MIKKLTFPLLLQFSLLSLSLLASVNLSQTARDSFFPAIAVNSSGEVMVVWTEWEGDNKMYYRIFRNGQWSQIQNAGIVKERAWSNQLSVDSYGTFHWTCADGFSSESRDIYYSYFTGSGWAAAEMLYRSPYNSAWNKMDIDTNNDIHVVWYHSHIPKGDVYQSDIVTMAKKRMGTWPTSFEYVSNSRTLESIHPAIAVLKGNVYCCWMEGASRKLYFNEKVGGRWGTPREIDPRGYYPDMEVDSSGDLHIVFSSRAGNIYYLTRSGGKWRTKQILSNGGAPLQFPDIHEKNNILVAGWVQGQGGNWAIYGATKLPGTQWSAPFKVSNAPGGEEGNKHVQVFLDQNNYAHFVWEQIGVGGKHDIFYEKIPIRGVEGPYIEVDNSYLTFQTDGSYNPESQIFNLRAGGKGSFNYSLSSNRSWLHVSPKEGHSQGEWDTISVEVDIIGLEDGTYNGTITITASEAYNSPYEVMVSLTIGEPQGPTYLELDTQSLSFSTKEGRNPGSQAFKLRATGGAASYKISTNKDWLHVSPQQGSSSGEWDEITVSVECENLKHGTRNGTIIIESEKAQNSPLHISVTLVIEKRELPSIQLSRTSLYFWAYAKGDNPEPKTFLIRNGGAKTLEYELETNKEWLKLSPKKGSSSGEWDTITVSVEISSLNVNNHTGKITIRAQGADNSPLWVNLQLEIMLPPNPYPPLKVKVTKINHEGLMIKEYKNKIEWEENPKNDGLFAIEKYRIYRKDTSAPDSPFLYLNEVQANTFIYFDGGFSTKAERNKYAYSVTCLSSDGKESFRSESIDGEETQDEPPKEINKRKEAFPRRK